MTINSTTRKTNNLAGNGNTHTYPFAFKVFADSEIVVKKLEVSTSIETTLTLGVNNDYIVTLNQDQNGNPGGSITLKSGGNNYNLPSGFQVVITSAVQSLQGTDLTNQGGFYPEVINDALDKSAILHQQQQDELNRSIKFSLTNTIGSLEITENANARKNKVLSFDNAGEFSVLKELGTYRGNWAASTSYAVRDLVKDTSTGNVFFCNTAHTSSGSQPLTTNTHSANWDLIVDAASSTTAQTNAAASATASANSATAAASSQTAAANSATAAATSETNASNSATTASTKATQAATSESNASTSATNAASSATAAAASAAAAAGDLVSDTSPQLGGELDTNNFNIKLSDGEKLLLHDHGSLGTKTGATNAVSGGLTGYVLQNSTVIDSGSLDLWLRSTGGKKITFGTSDSLTHEVMRVQCAAVGASQHGFVNLNYVTANAGQNASSATKLVTTSTGVTVTGTVAATAYTGDGSALTGVSSQVADGCITENSQTISNNYTMTTNKSGISAGPITIANNKTITIPSNSRYVIV
jgi:hypothetical protein